MSRPFDSWLSDEQRLSQREGERLTTQWSGARPISRPPSSIRIPDVEKQMLYGEDILVNPPPVDTARNPGDDTEKRHLYTLFENPYGQRFALNQERLSKHLLLLGGIGSGKTNVFNFLLESLLERQQTDDIIFIFDTKGDFYRRFYKSYTPRHILIGNAPRYADKTRHWNIFGEMEGPGGTFTPADELIAKEIGNQLFVGRESGNQPFFSLAAADLTSKILIDFERQARKTGDRSNLHNWNLASWIHSANAAQYAKLLRRNPDFASAQLYFGDPAQSANQKLTPQALSVFAYIVSMCNDLLTGIFAAENPSLEFSMRSLVRNRSEQGGRKVVFIEYDLNVGEIFTPMYRLLIDLALKEAMGQGDSPKGNVIFVIDEFKLLPNLLHIDDALNFGRSLGVKILAGIQSIDQLYANYGEERGKVIASGFMNCFCFQTPDSSSRRYISERFGENRYQLAYHSNGEYQSVQKDGHAIEDWDILNLPVGQAAVDLSGERPFLFQFSDFERPHPIL